MTVDELREKMTMDEFIHWSIYYARKAQRIELAQKMAKK